MTISCSTGGTNWFARGSLPSGEEHPKVCSSGDGAGVCQRFGENEIQKAAQQMKQALLGPLVIGVELRLKGQAAA